VIRKIVVSANQIACCDLVPATLMCDAVDLDCKATECDMYSHACDYLVSEFVLVRYGNRVCSTTNYFTSCYCFSNVSEVVDCSTEPPFAGNQIWCVGLGKHRLAWPNAGKIVIQRLLHMYFGVHDFQWTCFTRFVIWYLCSITNVLHFDNIWSYASKVVDCSTGPLFGGKQIGLVGLWETIVFNTLQNQSLGAVTIWRCTAFSRLEANVFNV